MVLQPVSPCTPKAGPPWHSRHCVDLVLSGRNKWAFEPLTSKKDSFVLTHHESKFEDFWKENEPESRRQLVSGDPAHSSSACTHLNRD